MSPLRLLGALALLLLAPLAAAQPGTLDPTFGTDGVHAVPGFASLALATQPDGAFILAGAEADDFQPSLRRFLPDGAPDLAFGTQGRAFVPVDGGLLLGVAIQPDGALVAVGSRELADGFSRRQFVARLTPGGVLDTSFGTGGVRELDGLSFFATVAVTATADGGTVVAWSDLDTTGGLLALRFRADGSQDLSFGTDGTAALATEQLATVYVTAVQVDAAGRVLVTGAADGGPNGEVVFAVRLLASGAPDPAYGTDAVATATTPTGFAVGTAATLSPDGLVVAGYDAYNESDPGGSGSAFLAMRFTDSGALDATFGTGGIVIVRPERDGGAFAVSLDADGRIVLGGGYGEVGAGDDDGVLLRLLRDGSVDTSFGDDGFARIAPQSSVNGLARLADGSFVAAGIGAEESFLARVIGGTVVASEPDTAPSGLGLVATGPNPARDRTTFRLTPTAPGPVRVTVTDVRGRTVAVLHDGAVARPVDLALDASGLAPGVYLVRAQGAGASAALRVTVVR